MGVYFYFGVVNELLQLEGGEPTDHYEYSEAVADGYLVDYLYHPAHLPSPWRE